MFIVLLPLVLLLALTTVMFAWMWASARLKLRKERKRNKRLNQKLVPHETLAEWKARERGSNNPWPKK